MEPFIPFGGECHDTFFIKLIEFAYNAHLFYIFPISGTSFLLYNVLVITPEDFNGVDWIAKMKELGLNTLGLHSGGGASHDVTAVLGDYAKEEFRKRVADAGLDLEYEDHAADSLLDRSLFKTHPEYFPMHCISGERREKGNWCISNPDVAELLASNAVNLAEKLVPSTHRHYFWSCDFHGGWCHCPACSAMTVSDQNLASVNAMAKALREADPQAAEPEQGTETRALFSRLLKRFGKGNS